AAAGDLDGTITNVEFFAGGKKIGEARNPPYMFEWKNPPHGHHKLTARVMDNRGRISFSPVIGVEIVPGVSLTRTRVVADATGPITAIFMATLSSPSDE